jgi:hypothetical protein
MLRKKQDVSEEYIAFIFVIKEREPSKKKTTSCLLGILFHPEY